MAPTRALADVDEGIRERIAFLVTAHTLTGVERRNRLLDNSRAENSAEHSWHLALCALVLAPTFAPTVDLGHVLALLTVHDVIEVIAGDIPYDDPSRTAQAAIDATAARTMFATFPDGERLLTHWNEYSAAVTPEARFAQGIDHLQPILVHWAGGGRVWRERPVARATVQQRVADATAFWPPIGHLASRIVADAAKRGDFVA
jgi:putative hydrolase of HD superfamily